MTMPSAAITDSVDRIGFLSHPHPLVENQFDQLILKRRKEPIQLTAKAVFVALLRPRRRPCRRCPKSRILTLHLGPQGVEYTLTIFLSHNQSDGAFS